MAHTGALPQQDHDAEGRPVHTSEVGLPMNAYTMGYGHGIAGFGVARGMAGSERYMRGYKEGTAQWDMYIAQARGEG